MTRRVKVGDVEVAINRNPDPTKTNWLVTRYRPRSQEYLSKQEALTFEKAEYLFTQVVGQEQLRQRQEAKRAAAALQNFLEPEGLASAEAALYDEHPLYARF